MAKNSIIPDEKIIRRIILLREDKVLLDIHLAELYNVETRVLKQAVRRNMDRFPSDFMFELTNSEIDYMVSQNVIPSKQILGGAKPFGFTESGVAMLSSVLNSKRAIEVNISIIRSFVFLRRLASSYSEIMKKLEQMESTYDGKFKEVYKALNYLIDPPQEKRRQIGFKNKNS
jgi:hypothetical protein